MPQNLFSKPLTMKCRGNRWQIIEVLWKPLASHGGQENNGSARALARGKQPNMQKELILRVIEGAIAATGMPFARVTEKANGSSNAHTICMLITEAPPQVIRDIQSRLVASL